MPTTVRRSIPRAAPPRPADAELRALRRTVDDLQEQLADMPKPEPEPEPEG